VKRRGKHGRLLLVQKGFKAWRWSRCGPLLALWIGTCFVVWAVFSFVLGFDFGLSDGGAGALAAILFGLTIILVIGWRKRVRVPS
jgi:energy-coupling factor transporter transmembrane protein EcfT